MLCEKLGFPSPRWLLPLLHPDEVTGWNAYYKIVYDRSDRASEDAEEEALPQEALLDYFRGSSRHRYAEGDQVTSDGR